MWPSQTHPPTHPPGPSPPLKGALSQSLTAFGSCEDGQHHCWWLTGYHWPRGGCKQSIKLWHPEGGGGSALQWFCPQMLGEGNCTMNIVARFRHGKLSGKFRTCLKYEISHNNPIAKSPPPYPSLTHLLISSLHPLAIHILHSMICETTSTAMSAQPQRDLPSALIRNVGHATHAVLNNSPHLPLGNGQHPLQSLCKLFIRSGETGPGKALAPSPETEIIWSSEDLVGSRQPSPYAHETSHHHHTRMIPHTCQCCCVGGGGGITGGRYGGGGGGLGVGALC